ncbi:hypothetical protein BX666DRAFT_2018047 [Dichotomocladium elegans]|nr:hypothetical protein BX666DRAFT_2018047 [Dichotomocladium elegans]
MDNLHDECEKAARILRSFTAKDEVEKGFDTVIPVKVLQEAKGLAIFTVIKAGFLWSGRAGSGIVIASLALSDWSAPSAIATGGIGIGAQIGADITDIVLILNSDEAVHAFSKGGNVTLGGNLAVSAGPIGAGGEASISSDTAMGKKPPMFSYSKSKGLFAGMSIEGTGLIELSKTNHGFYGQDIKAEEILKGNVSPPQEAQVLYDAIKKAESRDAF